MRAGTYGVGGVFTARGVSSTNGRLVTDSTESTFPLQTEGLPFINLRFKQSAPIAAGKGAKVTLQGSVRAVGTPNKGTFAGPSQAEWFTLREFIAAPGVDTLPFGQSGYDFAVSKVRIVVDATGIGEDVTVEYAIAAHG